MMQKALFFTLVFGLKAIQVMSFGCGFLYSPFRIELASAQESIPQYQQLPCDLAGVAQFSLRLT